MPTWADLVFFLLECDQLRFPQESNSFGGRGGNDCNFSLRFAMFKKIANW